MNILHFDPLIQVIGLILGSTVISSIITSWFIKKRTKAEANKLNAEADVDIAKSAMNYIKYVEESLREEIRLVKAKNVELTTRVENLTAENFTLRQQISDLKAELDRYEGR